MALIIENDEINLTLEEEPITILIASGDPGPAGPPGPAGADGIGVPAGGETGQVLKKASSTDYDTEWGEGGGGLDEVTWDDIQDKPESFPPSAHTHDDRYYTETETDALLADKAEIAHNHDDRYYTEAETDALLTDKVSSDDLGALAFEDTVDSTRGGVPDGGALGQVLAKDSNEDLNASWHNAIDLIGTVPINQGGTGATSATTALSNLCGGTKLIRMEATTGSAFTIGHTTSTNFKDVTVTPQTINGFTVIAACGYVIAGAGGSYAQVSQHYFDGTNIHVYLKNLDGSNDRTWTPKVYALYVSNKILPS